MMKALKGLSLFGGLAVVLTLFFVIGCSNYTPVQSTDPDPVELGGIAFGERSLQLSEASTLEEFDSGYIEKSTGGTIEIERGDYVHEFVVEPYAIEQSTTITVRSVNEVILGKDMVLFEFGPDGLDFEVAAKLAFEIAEINGDATSANLYYYDPVEKKWIYQDSVSVVEGIAEFEINHFSKYAISD
ncbi:MAG: hypothetical protein JSW64_00675 [Candidatus Zixiibacteriota bacterium]|nr:MAG: hypothetical protein JSW64_00675 [candidate division Zixibacteria bacterium]